MREPLQAFGFKDSAYERVDQEWRCDCPGGPDSKGRCRANPPCVPVRSLRAKRGQLSAMVCMGTLALLLIFLFGREQGGFLSPGGLSQVHANLENGCASCHSAAAESPESWLAAAFTTSVHSEAESGCLACHDFGAQQANMFAPHGMDAERIAASRADAGEFARSSVDAFSVQCIDCHREHQGAQQDLLELASASCKTCHVEHTSFPEQHGKAPGMLARRLERPAIVFDHDVHYGAGELRAACMDCHLMEDADGRVVVSLFDGLNYGSQCAQCHEAGDLRAGFDAGISRGSSKLKDSELLAYLRLPKYTEEIEGLPAWAAERGESSLNLPSEAKILLGAAYADWMLLGDSKLSFRSRSIQKRSAEENAAAGRLLQSIVAALGEFGDPDLGVARAAFKRRVQASIGVSPTGEELEALLPEELHAAFVRAQQDWIAAPLPAPEKGEESDGPTGRGAFAHDLTVGVVPHLVEGPGRSAWVHASPIVQAWAPLVARLAMLEEAASEEPRERSAWRLDALANSFAGRCVKCHSVDELAGDSAGLLIHWNEPVAKSADSSMFTHAPHIGRQDCRECHTSLGSAEVQFNSLSIARRDDKPLPVDRELHPSNFAAPELSGCAQCHAPGMGVANACTTCHDFHPTRSTHAVLELSAAPQQAESAGDE